MAWLGYLILLLVATRQRTKPFVFLSIVLGILAVLIYATYRVRKYLSGVRMRREMRRTVQIGVALRDHGMTVVASTPFATRLALLQPFELGQRGETDTQMVRHFMESSPDSKQMIWMMDYSYVKGNGERRRALAQTVVLIEHADLDLPHFYLSKELPFQWLEKLAKAQDIDFEEHPKFNKLFRLMGEDEAAVRALFTMRNRDGLERHPGLTIEGRGSQLLIFREWTVLAPDKWPEFLEEARDCRATL
jgi:hypothetical protein